MIKGIDVSRWQGTINWLAIQDEYKFAIIKASEYIADPTFVYNWTKAREAGMLRGAYHFFRANVDPVEQAKTLIKVVKGTNDLGEIGFVSDTETCDGIYDKWLITQRVKAFMERVVGETGKNGLIYTSPGFWSGLTYKQVEWALKYDLWVAHWYVDTPRLPVPWNKWIFWQYGIGNKGTVKGINAKIDLNYFNGTYQDLLNYCGGTPLPPPPITTKAKCLVYSLRIRNKPTTNSSTIGGLKSGEIVNVYGEVKENNNIWLKLSETKEMYAAMLHDGYTYMKYI